MMPDTFLRLGLTGWPLQHSLSPRIHQAALRSLRLEGEYCLYPVSPEEREVSQLESLVARLRAGELHGLNVTIPFKVRICSLLDELTPRAAAIGAINTLYERNGRVIGENTDSPGFLAAVRQEFPQFFTGDEKRRALVLGAGGAARAVIYALLERGWQVALAARSLEAAEGCVEQLEKTNHSGEIEVIRLEPESLIQPLKEHSPDLIVNATSAGMAPDVDVSPWPHAVPWPKNACVYDLVYTPPLTHFVREARAAGLPAQTGLGMLVSQAAVAFELWTGLPAPMQAIWQELQDWRKI